MGLKCKEQAAAVKNQPYNKGPLNKCAAYAFLQAYALHPGWAIVDHELDMLDDAVHQIPAHLAPRRLSTDWGPQGFNLHSILAFRYKMEQLA